jgi:high-affinity Fe2+/Pb2+ permease
MNTMTASTGTSTRPAWFRRAHRALATLFTLSVVATSIALAQAEPIMWMSYVPLFPLALLMLTGLYLLALPHVRRWRAVRAD